MCNLQIKHSYDERRLILLSLFAAARRRFSYSEIDDFNWTSIDRKVSSDLHVSYALDVKI